MEDGNGQDLQVTDRTGQCYLHCSDDPFDNSFFPVIQPLAVYGNSVKQLEDLPKDMELLFNDGGVFVFVGEKSESLAWKRIKNAIKRSNMIVVMSDDSHGYMLTNRVLGNQKEEFYQYICKKIRG